MLITPEELLDEATGMDAQRSGAARHRTLDTDLLLRAAHHVADEFATIESIRHSRRRYAEMVQQLVWMANGDDHWAQETLDVLVIMHDAAEKLLRLKGIDAGEHVADTRGQAETPNKTLQGA